MHCFNCFVVAAASRGAVAQGSSDATLIRNVRVFDGERVTPNTSVLMANGRISRVAPSITAPAGATVVDGSGKTLLPGYIDSHTQTWGAALRDAVVLGVTTVLDMFTEPKAAADMEALRAATSVPARTFSLPDRGGDVSGSAGIRVRRRQ